VKLPGFACKTGSVGNVITFYYPVLIAYLFCKVVSALSVGLHHGKVADFLGGNREFFDPKLPTFAEVLQDDVG
jgi:hypothetical protein